MGDYQNTSEIKETLDLLLELNSIFFVKINTEEDDENKNLLTLKKVSSFKEYKLSKNNEYLLKLLFVEGFKKKSAKHVKISTGSLKDTFP